MAPSATAEIALPTSKVEVAEHLEKHSLGSESKTPLEAISHGPLVLPGTISFHFSFQFIAPEISSQIRYGLYYP